MNALLWLALILWWPEIGYVVLRGVLWMYPVWGPPLESIEVWMDDQVVPAYLGLIGWATGVLSEK